MSTCCWHCRFTEGSPSSLEPISHYIGHHDHSYICAAHQRRKIHRILWLSAFNLVYLFSVSFVFALTAIRLDNTRRPIRGASQVKAGPFNYGAGHVDPNAAANPGLVYDLSNKHYYLFFCSLNYSSSQIETLTGRSYHCPVRIPKPYEFNYPSITVSDLRGSVFLKRTVTNVGEEASVYVARVRPPRGVNVTIWPKTLKFSKTGEKLSFTVKLEASRNSKGKYFSGLLRWTDGRRVVTIPIVVNNAVPARKTDDVLP